MAIRASLEASGDAIRRPSVAGSFYPAPPVSLAALVHGLLAEAERLAAGTEPPGPTVLGVLVPHAGLAYSGVVAAAGWRLLGHDPGDLPPTVVILGTNHVAAGLAGVAVWEAGAWRTPLGDLAVDVELARAIVELGPPFTVDRGAHLGEHSIEVQLPLLAVVAPEASIVPLSVGLAPGSRAIATGERLGALLASRRDAGRPIVLAISSDMAHYPSSGASELVTQELLPAIVRLDPAALARMQRDVVERGIRGLVCGMCGIAPTVIGLAALRAFRARRGVKLAAATSFDAGGPADSTVGYLAVAFTP
jgi:hypothetical protein